MERMTNSKDNEVRHMNGNNDLKKNKTKQKQNQVCFKGICSMI